METIPRKDYDFNVVQENISSTANENRDVWKLDDEWLDNILLPAKSEWISAWAEYQSPITRTMMITFTKNNRRKIYEKLLRKLVKILQASTRVTDKDLTLMKIAIPTYGRTTTPVPETYPVATVDCSVIRRLGIHYRDSNNWSIAKPYRVHGAEIKWGIDVELSVSPATLPNSSFNTRTPFILEFTENERGKTVHFCLRWENTVGAKGPWGEIATAIVP